MEKEERRPTEPQEKRKQGNESRNRRERPTIRKKEWKTCTTEAIKAGRQAAAIEREGQKGMKQTRWNKGGMRTKPTEGAR